jgi:dynein light intermediate chain 1
MQVIARIGIHQLAGDPAYASLLKYAVNQETIADDLVVMIVLDWSKPWDFVKSIEHWVEVIEKRLFQLFLTEYGETKEEKENMSLEEQEERKRRGKEMWQSMKDKGRCRAVRMDKE